MVVSFRPARPEDAAELWRLNTAFNGPGDKAPAEMAADLAAPGGDLTKADMMDKGLVGPNSAARRQQVLRDLGLPEHLTANGLLEALNLLLTREEFEKL